MVSPWPPGGCRVLRAGVRTGLRWCEADPLLPLAPAAPHRFSSCVSPALSPPPPGSPFPSHRVLLHVVCEYVSEVCSCVDGCVGRLSFSFPVWLNPTLLRFAASAKTVWRSPLFDRPPHTLPRRRVRVPPSPTLSGPCWGQVVPSTHVWAVPLHAPRACCVFVRTHCGVFLWVAETPILPRPLCPFCALV